ncbi:hypothetical protein [uncultured Thiodictyon sp.]|uniref:hypothetical protein n=1 Tax=uncultured Thiodictyon sp. TaxID=1846217 RepID=UPI0025D7BE38|nr:hypothetical protein [uncultured Thiodictyon sp.]
MKYDQKIYDIQKRLSEEGYIVTIDGHDGPQTQRALRAEALRQAAKQVVKQTPKRLSWILRFALARAREASTWRGIIMLAAGSWATAHPDQAEAVIAAGIAIAGAIGALFPDAVGAPAAGVQSPGVSAPSGRPVAGSTPTDRGPFFEP